MLGPKRDEVTGGWRKLHNEELHNLYSSPSIIRMIKSGKIRWTGHVVLMGEKRNNAEFRWESQKEKVHQEYLNVDGENNIELNVTEIGWGDVD
jgi:hypothetical protein